MENKETNNKTVYEILTNSEMLKESIEHEHIKNLIEDVMCANFCEDDPQQYVKYLDKDLDEIEKLQHNHELDHCLANHLIEEIELLKDIIQTIYKGEE